MYGFRELRAVAELTGVPTAGLDRDATGGTASLGTPRLPGER
jgi:hypothetical protein